MADKTSEVKTTGGPTVSKTGQGGGVGEAQNPKINQAKGAVDAKESNENKKFDYDDWHNKMKEEREVEGGEQIIGSGLEKGRPIKEDGTLDFDQPSLFEQRFSEESATTKKIVTNQSEI